MTDLSTVPTLLVPMIITPDCPRIDDHPPPHTRNSLFNSIISVGGCRGVAQVFQRHLRGEAPIACLVNPPSALYPPCRSMPARRGRPAGARSWSSPSAAPAPRFMPRHDLGIDCFPELFDQHAAHDHDAHVARLRQLGRGLVASALALECSQQASAPRRQAVAASRIVVGLAPMARMVHPPFFATSTRSCHRRTARAFCGGMPWAPSSCLAR